MKTSLQALLCLMLFAVACRAQTVKWSAETQPSTFQPTSAVLYHGKADALGNLAVVVSYFDDIGFKGTKLFWYTPAGKLMTSDETSSSGLRLNYVVSVCATSVIVELLDASGNRAIRKYQKRGSSVTKKDTPLEASEYLANDAVNTGIYSDDTRAFYVVSPGVEGVRIKRYLR